MVRVGCIGVVPTCAYLYWVWLGSSGFYWVSPSFTGFYPSIKWFKLVLLSFYQVLLGFLRFLKVEEGFT